MSPARLISSGSPFEKTYGYSRAVVWGDEVHIAGTTGYDYAKMTMPDDVAEQTRNIYATFAKVMGEAGGELADIVRLRTFVTDAAYGEAVLKVQGEVFGAIRPGGDDRRRPGAVEPGNEGRDRGRRAAATGGSAFGRVAGMARPRPMGLWARWGDIAGGHAAATCPAAPSCNRRANFRRCRRKKKKLKESKMAFFLFFSLSFTFWNRGFSKGWSRKN